MAWGDSGSRTKQLGSCFWWLPTIFTQTASWCSTNFTAAGDTWCLASVWVDHLSWPHAEHRALFFPLCHGFCELFQFFFSFSKSTTIEKVLSPDLMEFLIFQTVSRLKLWKQKKSWYDALKVQLQVCSKYSTQTHARARTHTHTYTLRANCLPH